MVKYKNIQEYLKQNYSDKETVKFITFNATSLTLEESKELTISDYPQLERIITQGSGNIKNINKVTVNNCPQLKEIKISKFSDNKKLEIKDCPNIEIIYCRENQLTELDISDFPQLKELSCGTNKITNLDLSNCLQLEKLWCGNNQLSSLDLSNYARLKEIYCNANKLTSLKLNNCHQLEIIECYANHLNNLDLTGCEQLKILKCWINQLTQLDLSQNKHLTELRCSKNKINELNLPEKLNNLHCLYCSVNQLADLDFLNSLNPEKLEKISVGENNFPLHDLTVFTPFKELKELKIDSVTGQGSFTGSLKILQKLEKLEVLDIRGNDDIDQGLKYLLKSLKDLSCARTKLTKSKEIKKIPKQYYSVDKSNIDHYDIDKWREDQQDTIIEVIPLERLFVIRSNLKKYVDKWSKEEDCDWYQLNQKQTEKQIALVRLQNPTDYSKSWWTFTGLQWVNRAASVVGGSLVFVGQSDTENPNSQLHTQVGGVIAIASPFVETLTSYVNDQIYAAKQKTWDEFISDTKNTLESYHELLGILEKIEKKEVGEVNRVLNDLREATKIFLDEYDKEDRANNIRKNGVIDIDEITENKPREKFAKDLSRERKWTGASQLGRIVGMMKKLEEGIINYRQERDIDAQQHDNCLEELDNQKQELAWTIIDILKGYSSSEFDSEIEYNEKGKINWNGKSSWESYLKNEIRDGKEFEEKKENLLLPLAEIIAKRLENTNIQTLLDEPQDKNKLVEFLKKTKDFCETCQRLKGLENNLSSLKDNIEELQKLIVKSDTEAKEELVVAIRNEEEKELKTIIETIKNLEQSLGTLHAKLTDNKGKEKAEYVAQQEHVDNNGKFASGSKSLSD